VDAAWYEGTKDEYRETVVTKHFKVMSGCLFDDRMNHEEDSQTDERFKDGHNEEEREGTAVIGSLPAF
jgi:hypothetical protein